VLRLWLLLFGDGSGASAGFGELWLIVGGMATLTFGLIGVLASQELSRVAGFSLLVSSGTLLAAVGAGQSTVTAAALYYLIVSTLGISAFYLLIELVERGRGPGADVLAVSAEAFAIDDVEEMDAQAGFAIPATMAFLGLSFACCALVIAGLPPLPGFVGKFALLSALLDPNPIPNSAWAILILLILSGLAAIIALSRIGIRIFWATETQSMPRVHVAEMTPVMLLLAVCGALTVEAGPAMRYLQSTADSLHAPRTYIERVLSPALSPR
jgi:multicomponent K+:H+ antiporter subunit D